MSNSTRELIETLERLKSEIEWDFSLEYQIALDKVIGMLYAKDKETGAGQSQSANR